MIGLVFVFYILMILYLIVGNYKIKTFRLKNLPPKNCFSIIIPFKNEAQNLPQLIESLQQLHYPKAMFEVLFVDDNSTDGYTIPKDLNFRYRVLKNNSGFVASKKQAINLGVEQAVYQWIVTTDADCIVSEKWLCTFNDFIENTPKAKMICAMVFVQPEQNMLNSFQQLDFMSLQATTIGAFGQGFPFMCNGANFAYQKSFFQALKGFEGNEHIASGDDVFLLQKAVENYRENVFYMKSENAVVQTKGVVSWSKLIAQRLRWGSKTKAYNSFKPKMIAILVVSTNVLICFGLFYFSDFWHWIVLKIGVDFWLIAQTEKFASRVNLFYTFVSLLIYPYITLYIVLKMLLKSGKYAWK